MWFLVNIIQFITLVLWFIVPGFFVVFLLPKSWMYRFIRGVWCKWGLLILGIRIKVKGTIPNDGRSFMFLANHQSYADILVLNIALARPLHYIAKKELTKIPVLGHLMRKTDCILVSRGYNKKSRKTYNEAIAHIKKGLDIVVFPEGTRTRTGDLGRIRKGSFQMATDAGIDIIPVAIKKAGTYWPRNNFSFRPGIIEVTIGEPIKSEDFSRENVQDLINDYEKVLNALLDE